MDKDIATALGRADRYLFRIKRALRNDELAVALADTAELHQIALRLWTRLESLSRVGETRGELMMDKTSAALELDESSKTA